ncbi:MAG: hypothetical protein AAF623_16705, partial [Planctomycetota bacterium]
NSNIRCPALDWFIHSRFFGYTQSNRITPPTHQKNDDKDASVILGGMVVRLTGIGGFGPLF